MVFKAVFALACLSAIVVASASTSLKSLSTSDGVFLFEVPTPDSNDMFKLTGGPVTDESTGMIYYGGSDVVFQVALSSDHSEATLQKTYGLSAYITDTFYQYLATPAPFDTVQNGMAWFGTRAGGLGGGIIGIKTSSPDNIPEEGDYITNTRVKGVVGDKQTGIPYILLDNKVYARDTAYQNNLRLVGTFASLGYFDRNYGNVPNQLVKMHKGYLYINAFQDKPGQGTWMTMLRMSVATGMNETLWVQRLDKTNGQAMATYFFDDSNMYLVTFPCIPAAHITGGAYFCQLQTSDTLTMLQYPVATAFSAPAPPVSNTFDCPDLAPQPGPTMVDLVNEKVYLQCGNADWTRFTIPGASSPENYCDLPSDTSLSQIPANAPSSGMVPFAVTSYGSVGYSTASNWVGILDIQSIKWRTDACPGPWFIQWWFITLVLVILITGISAGVWCCCQRCNCCQRVKCCMCCKPKKQDEAPYTDMTKGESEI